MRNGDRYEHYKGVEYLFDCIALPLEGRVDVKPLKTVRYHEDTHDIQLYICDNGVTYIDADVPHVIYQSEKHYGTDLEFAREVDDFYGSVPTKDGHQRRFALKPNPKR